MTFRIIHIHPAAPAKPAEGEPCNGCGVCCLSEPCPLGVLLSARRTGACEALQWVEPQDQGLGIYRCGALNEPEAVLIRRLPRAFHGWVPILARGLPRVAQRWISAGSGCDCSLSVDARQGTDPHALHCNDG